MEECIFCKIVKGEIPSKVIYEDDDMMAFLDIHPNSLGHTLVIPKKHTRDLETIDNETLLTLLTKTRNLSQMICQKLGASGYRIVQNNGNLQEVKHFHIHIIPSYKEERRESLEEVYQKIMN